jgi:hypothetical protein
MKIQTFRKKLMTKFTMVMTILTGALKTKTMKHSNKNINHEATTEKRNK